jgi:hypothetical protein
MPHPSDDRVLMRSRVGSVKSVKPGRVEQLRELGWSEVSKPSAKKRPAALADESTPAVVPDNDSQEG